MGLGPLLPGFQFSAFMNLHLQIPLATRLPTVPLSLLFLEVSVFCNPLSLLFCDDAGALLYFPVPYGSMPFGRSVCPAFSLTSVTARDREESSRASGNIEDRKQLEYMYQMYGTCLHIPIQDFLERNVVVHYVAFAC